VKQGTYKLKYAEFVFRRHGFDYLTKVLLPQLQFPKVCQVKYRKGMLTVALIIELAKR
jgi:hypothetical protein